MYLYFTVSPSLILYVYWCLCSYNDACSLVQASHCVSLSSYILTSSLRSTLQHGKPAETLFLLMSQYNHLIVKSVAGQLCLIPLFSVSWFAWRDVVNKNRKPQREGGNATCKMKFHLYLMKWYKFLERLNVSSPGKKFASVIL